MKKRRPAGGTRPVSALYVPLLFAVFFFKIRLVSRLRPFFFLCSFRYFLFVFFLFFANDRLRRLTASFSALVLFLAFRFCFFFCGGSSAAARRRGGVGWTGVGAGVARQSASRFRPPAVVRARAPNAGVCVRRKRLRRKKDVAKNWPPTQNRRTKQPKAKKKKTPKFAKQDEPVRSVP